MGDAHGNVIGDNRQVVDGAVVAPQNHEVVQVPSLKADASVYGVVPGNLGVIHDEADGRRCSPTHPKLCIRRSQVAAAPVVAEPHTRSLGLRPLRIQLLPGTEAAIGLPLSQEALRIGLMPGRVLSLEKRPFIPGDSEPAQSIQNDFGMLLGATLAVGVLDPEHVSTAGMPGIEPVEERRACSPDVEVSGGRWGEADAWWVHGLKICER